MGIDSEVNLGQKHVMVVDDEPDMRLLASTILEQLGYDVIECKDPEEAFEAAQRSRPDLAVIDITMYGIKTAGYDLVRRLDSDEQTRGIPVIHVSGNSEGNLTPERAEWLGKPFALRDLERKIAGKLNGSAHHP